MLYLSRDASAQVLVDPSCSGSGMRHEHSSVIEESNVRELVELQTSVLKHALSFPQALRVVYRCSMFQPNEAMQWPLMLVSSCSTCSHYEAENEGVVEAVGIMRPKPFSPAHLSLFYVYHAS